MVLCIHVETSVCFPQHILKLNYGLVAQRQRMSCIHEGDFLSTVRIRLPTRPVFNGTVNQERTKGVVCDPFCQRLKILANCSQQLVQSMQSSISALIVRIYDLLPDINDVGLPMKSSRRISRGLANFIGRGMKFFFGTAVDSDLDQMRKTIADAQLMSRTAASETQQIRASVSNFMRVNSSDVSSTTCFENRSE